MAFGEPATVCGGLPSGSLRVSLLPAVTEAVSLDDAEVGISCSVMGAVSHRRVSEVA